MKINIQATCDQVNKSISVKPETVSFIPGDIVVWEFVGLEDGQSPEINFAGPPMGTGPFTTLLMIPSAIIASGSAEAALTGESAMFPYLAIVRAPDGSQLMDGAGHLEKKFLPPPSWHSNLDILVQVDPDNPGHLIFTPDTDLHVVAGDTVTWYFYLDFEPKDVHIRFLETSTNTEDPFGPFESIRVKRFHPGGLDWTEEGNTQANLELRCTLQASNAGKTPGQYAYTLYADKPSLQRLWLRRAMGDPIVDNLGPPIDGGGV